MLRLGSQRVRLTKDRPASIFSIHGQPFVNSIDIAAQSIHSIVFFIIIQFQVTVLMYYYLVPRQKMYLFTV